MSARLPSALEPEGELLVCCARLDPGPAQLDRIRQLLGGPLDADHLLGLAARHGLRPLLYRHLSAIGEASIPRHIHINLWAAHELRGRRNGAMADELLRIVELLDSNEIPCIPYKGPALAEALYGDLGLREFGDLDVLLRAQDVLAAKALLTAHGYAPLYDLKARAEAAFLRSAAQYHLVLMHDASAIMVELHWKTDPDFAVEALLGDALWQRPRAASLGGQALRCFSPGELLLILCLHGSKHQWASLTWLIDIAELIRQNPALDWEWIDRSAQMLSGRRRLALGLHLAHHLLAADLPAQVLAKVEDARIDDIATDIAARLFARQQPATSALGSLRSDLKLYDRPGQRLKHCWNVIFAPSLFELSWWSLPRWLSFLYIPVRLGRLLVKYRPRLIPGRPR